MKESLTLFLGTIIVVVILASVKIMNGNATVENHDFNVVCLESVEYWYREAEYKGVLAVKYNADTGEIATCED